MDLSLCGSLFHKVGLATLKDLSVKVLHLVLGINSKYGSVLDLRLYLVGCGLCISFCKYWGPMPCRHLYVRVRILKAILYLIGNQCRCLSAWVALSNFDLLSTKHAHMFCILCSLFIEVSGNP